MIATRAWIAHRQPHRQAQHQALIPAGPAVSYRTPAMKVGRASVCWCADKSGQRGPGRGTAIG